MHMQRKEKDIARKYEGDKHDRRSTLPNMLAYEALIVHIGISILNIRYRSHIGQQIIFRLSDTGRDIAI